MVFFWTMETKFTKRTRVSTFDSGWRPAHRVQKEYSFGQLNELIAHQGGKLQNELRVLFCDQVLAFRTIAMITCEVDLTKLCRARIWPLMASICRS
jgi:hypothetical protein